MLKEEVVKKSPTKLNLLHLFTNYKAKLLNIVVSKSFFKHFPFLSSSRVESGEEGEMSVNLGIRTGLEMA